MQGGGGEEVSIEELASNLATYEDQLHQVRELLVDDPGNSEYVDMERELKEESKCCSQKQHQLTSNGTYGGLFFISGLKRAKVVLMQVIALTEELLATAKQNDISGSDIGTSGRVSPSLLQSKDNKMDLGSMSDYHANFPIGTRVQAVWSEDGEWYDGTIEAHTPNGFYICYDGWGNREEVDPANVRPIQEGVVNTLAEAERVAEATKQAIKRKIALAASMDFQSRSLPAKLRIDPTDSEDVKAAKRKKIHSFKSKMRLEQLEVTQNKRQNAWQQFQTTKGKTKKIGFYSGRKRESIFKSPEDPFGKVGVTGSGKGLTEFQKREKHLHLKGGTVEADD